MSVTVWSALWGTHNKIWDASRWNIGSWNDRIVTLKYILVYSVQISCASCLNAAVLYDVSTLLLTNQNHRKWLFTRNIPYLAFFKKCMHESRPFLFPKQINFETSSFPQTGPFVQLLNGVRVVFWQFPMSEIICNMIYLLCPSFYKSERKEGRKEGEEKRGRGGRGGGKRKPLL